MDSQNQKQNKFPLVGIIIIIAVVLIVIYGFMKSSGNIDSSEGVPTVKTSTSGSSNSSTATNKSSTVKTTTTTTAPAFRPTTVLKDVTFSARVENSTYRLGEKINIVLSVTNNNSLDTRAFNFSTNCQTTYWIGSFASNKGVICDAKQTSFTIPPKRVKDMRIIHDTAISPISVGTHTVTVELIGYGRATTKVTIVK